MRLLAAISDPDVARRILACLALPPRAPPLAPANEIDLGLEVGHGALELPLTQVQSDSGFDFDQSSAEERDSNEGP